MICAQCVFYKLKDGWCRKHLLNTGRYNWCEDCQLKSFGTCS